MGPMLYPSGPPMLPKVGWLRGEAPWVLFDVTLSRRCLYVQVGRAWVRWVFRPAVLPGEED